MPKSPYFYAVKNMYETRQVRVSIVVVENDILAGLYYELSIDNYPICLIEELPEFLSGAARMLLVTRMQESMLQFSGIHLGLTGNDVVIRLIQPHSGTPPMFEGAALHIEVCV